jgi:chromate transporter
MCLPGATLMYVVALAYRAHGDHALATAGLKGVAAAAVGLILATTFELGRKSFSHKYDLIFVILTVLGVNLLHQSVPRVLLAVGALATVWYRPRKGHEETSDQ